MTIEETFLKDCYLISPNVIEDDRGYFFESFNHKVFCETTGLNPVFVQDNQSKSNRGVLRGLHFQIGNYAQAKLVRVIAGSVLDVCVDLRPNSETYGKSLSVILNEENKKQLYIPRGFAHGFLVLEDNTIFNYKCDNYYNKSSESGILYNDDSLNIDWNFPIDDIILSSKDIGLPTFEALFK